VAQWKDLVGGPIWWRNKSNMADGRHLGFWFLAIISASINIFAPNFTPWWKIGSPRGPSAQKSDFWKSKMAAVRHLLFRFWAIISASFNIFAPNLVQWWKIGSPIGVPVFKNQIFLNCWRQRLRVFSVRSIAGSSIQWMMTTPKRGRGHGHVTYFWSNGTDTRVPQNVFLVIANNTVSAVYHLAQW